MQCYGMVIFLIHINFLLFVHFCIPTDTRKSSVMFCSALKKEIQRICYCKKQLRLILVFQLLFSHEYTLKALTNQFIVGRPRLGEKHRPCCVPKTVEHPHSVMVQGVVVGKSPGPLQFLQGSKVLEILQSLFYNPS